MKFTLPRRSSVATIAAVSLAFGLLIPAAPAVAEELYPDTGSNVLPTVSKGVPAYEPQMGRGEQLVAGQMQNIPLGAAPAAAHSALVRLSLFDAVQDIEVILAGAPALNVAKGRSASTTVLASVADGRIALQANADANLRVDVLAVFAGDPSAPGSTVALPEAVTRADTRGALASGGIGEGIGAAETVVGLIGMGGVPVEGVRSAHVTATVTAATPTTLILDGQRLPIGAGTTSISTVVTPSASGDVQAHAEGSAVQLLLHVRGYVAEAPENAAALNGAGSFWPTADATQQQHTISEAAAQAVKMESGSDARYVLALVAAAPTETLTLLELGNRYRGRSRGAVVDPVGGTQPQLAMVPAKDPALTLRRGTSAVSTLELGSFLGVDAGSETGSSSLSVTSPATASVDATDDFALNFEGKATPNGTAPLRIEVKLDGQPHGSAAVRPGDDGLEWSFTTAVKDSDEHTFEFTLVSRAGPTTTTDWRGRVTVPGPDATVLTPDTVVIGSEGHVAEVASIGADTIHFTSDPSVIPGEVIASAASAGAPDGFLRRVVAVDIVDGLWRLTTVPATLDEVFLQADFEQTKQLGAGDLAGVSQEPADPANAGSITNEYFDTLIGDQVDLAPFAGDAITPEGEILEDSTPAAMRSRASSDPGVAPMAWEAEESLSFAIGATLKDEEDGQGTDDIEVALSAGAKLGFALKITLKSELKWTEGSLFPPVPPLPYPGIDEFSTSMKSSAKAESKMSVAVEKSWSKEWDGPKKSISFTPITFTIGIFPVVVVSGVEIELKGEFAVTGTATLAASASVERKHELGFAYADGHVTKIDNGPESTVTPFGLDSGTGIAGKIEATVGPDVAFDAKIYGAAGPEIGFSIKVGTAITSEINMEKANVEFELFLQGTLFVKAELTVPVIKKDLLSVTLLEMTKKWGLKKTLLGYDELFPEDSGEGPGPGNPPEDEVDYGQDELTPAVSEVAALDVEGADVLSSFFVEGPPHPSATGVFERALGGLPTTGKDYLMLSTGNAQRLFDDSVNDGGFAVTSKRGENINDATTLRIDLDVPANVNCLIGFDFRFYSDEYPQFVGSSYNDAFIVELDKSTWTVEGNEIVAPRNFAFDEMGNPITINAAGPWTINAQNADGTPFGGATSLLRATTPVTPGKHSLFLSIFDMGDSVLDSAVLVDGIKFGSVENPATQCQQGVSAGN